MKCQDLRRHLRAAESRLDEAMSRLEILVEQEARRHEGFPDRVDMTAPIVLRKIGRESEGIDPPSEERFHRCSHIPGSKDAATRCGPASFRSCPAPKQWTDARPE